MRMAAEPAAGRALWARPPRQEAEPPAQMSEKHSNFLINTGDATAADLEGLGEDVRKRVYDSSGIALEWEIMRVGETTPAG